MLQRRGWLGLLFLLAGLLVPVSSARAVITYILPLQSILDESTYVCAVKVESLDPDRPSLSLVVEDNLMAKKAPWTSLPILMKGDAEAVKLKHVPDLYKRLDKDLPLLLFLSEKEKRIIGFAYTNGTWFQIVGTKDGSDVRWSLTHAEPGLRRTFKGTTAELKKEVSDVLGKKKEKAVAPDEKEKPGFGPEIDKKPEKKQGRLSRQGGSLFAVIPTVAIGGPLAILAMLFPAVFGGVFVLFRRWIVLITVIGINSTLYYLQGWFAESLQGTFWGSERLLWLTMTVVSLVGVGVTWRRQLKTIATTPALDPLTPPGPLDDPSIQPAPENERPGLLEQYLLYGVSGVTLVGLAVLLLTKTAVLPDFQLPLVICLGIWAGALATLFHVLTLPLGGGSAPRVPTEGVMLGVMTLGSLLLLPDGAHSVTAEPVNAIQPGERGAVRARTVWEFTRKAGVKEQFDVASSPTVVGDRVYIGMIRSSAFEGRSGIVYCLDRQSDKPVWSFDNDGDLRHMFSSPCVADGKVFIGEGFHEDRACKLFCLDAATGKNVWPPFATTSHVESTPVVAQGKVVFGAGDDGVYCLDINTGKQLWRFPKAPTDTIGLHVDASPVIHGNRVYCCSGVSQKYQKLQVFCLNLETGEPEWTQDKVEMPCWGSPAVRDTLPQRFLGLDLRSFSPALQRAYPLQVYIGLGKGRLTMSATPPAGGVLCLNAFNGERVWYFDEVKDAVHCKPTVDDNHVYFGSRDGTLYCLERRKGNLLWKAELGSPVVAAPALAECSHCGSTSTVYVASTMGQIYALDPITGRVFWSHSELNEKQLPQMLSSPTVVVSRSGDADRRLIYFATALITPGTSSQSARVFCIEDFWNDGTK